MNEDIILTTAVTVAKKKYTEPEEALIHELGKPSAKVDVLLPNDLDPEKFETALSAVSKVLAKNTLQREMMFTILGRLLFVAQSKPELWNKKYPHFEDFRLSLAERFGLGRQTTYDALEYAKHWSAALPPSEFLSVGRKKLKMIAKSIGKEDAGKATAKKAISFAMEHTAEELDEYLDEHLHSGRGSSEGTFIKFGANKKQEKIFKKWFGDPRVQAYFHSDQWSDMLEGMIESVKVDVEAEGERMILELAEKAKDAEREEKANTAA